MKKIVSILVALLMIASSLSAFAAIEVDPTSPSALYSNSFEGKADVTGNSDGNSNPSEMSGTGIVANKDHPIDFAFSGEKFVFSRLAGSKKSGLAYVHFSKEFEGNFSFGFDIKFDGLTATSEFGTIYTVTPGIKDTVHQDATMEKIETGEWYINEEDGQAYDSLTDEKKASKTSWCFYKKYADGTQSPPLAFSAKFVEPEPGDEGELLAEGDDSPAPEYVKDDNGKIAIFQGDAQLLQGETYTFKVNVNTVEKKYSTTIIDEDGNVQTGITNGVMQDAFSALYKLDTSIDASADATVTIDDIFVENYFGINLAPSWQANAEGTITFGATIPNNLTDAKLYINDTFIEDLTLTPGEIDYTITANLPADISFGEAVVEIRGKVNGVDVKTSAVTDITKSYSTGRKIVVDTPSTSGTAKGLRAFASGGTLSVPEDNTGVWAVTQKGQLDIVSGWISPALTGIVEYSFDFYTTTNLNQIRIRMTAASDGSAFKWAKGSVDTYHYFLNGYSSRKLGTLGVEYDLNDWNTFKVRADFYANKYYAYINGTLCEEGTLYADAGLTDKVADVRMIVNYTDANAATSTVLLDNFTLEEFGVVTTPITPSLNYSDGTSVEYVDEALTSVNLSNVAFKTVVPFDSASITDTTAKVVNADGEKVNTSLSYADGTFTASFGGAILPDGNYKLVIDKSATVLGEEIGLNREIDFAIKSDDCIIAPAADSTVSDATTLQVYAPNADKVVFNVNDSAVATVLAAEAENGFFSADFTPVTSGIQIVDAYVYTGDDIKLLTSNFNYLLTMKTMKLDLTMNDKKGMSVASGGTEGAFIDGAGFDESVAYQLTSKVGTIVEGKENNDTSISNTSSFAPGNNLYRKMVNEFELKAGENTYVYAEIGYSVNGKTYAERETVKVGTSDVSSYQTFYIRGSHMDNNAIFGKNGTLLGTSTQYTPNKWYRFKQTIDFDNKTNAWEVYEEGQDGKLDKLVLTTNDNISNIASSNASTAFPNWRNDIVITNKYKLCVLPIDKTKVQSGTPATVFVDNFSRYSPTSLPAAETVNGSDSYVIEEGTDEATVVLTTPYDSDFNSELITVKVNGKDYDAADVTVTDGANFTVSGLAGVKAGSKIEIVISDLAFFGGFTADSELIIPLYVADENALCVFPFATGLDDDGGLAAMAKYINGGSSVDSYLVITEYNGDKVAKTRFNSTLIEGGASGIIYGTLPNYDSLNETTIRLWNKADLSALVPTAPVSVTSGM